MSHKRVFISRALSANDELSVWADERGIELIGESLIEFEKVSVQDLPKADWYFFYSKRGAQYFLEQFLDHDYLRQSKMAAMGEATAGVLKYHGIKVDFTGSGNPEATAIAFENQILADEKICFVQAKNSRESIAKRLPKRFKTTSIVIYENKPKKDFDIPKCDAYILTSPMNADTFFGKIATADQQVISIGKTTYQHILDNHGIESLMPKKPYTADLVALMAKTLHL